MKTMKLSPKSKIILFSGIIFVLLSSFLIIFFAYDLHIPKNMKIAKMNFSDYFSSNHYSLSSSAVIYEIKITGYISHDKVKQTTIYEFIVEDGDSIGMKATITYPGTPSRQYYKIPRLSKNDRLLLVAYKSDIQQEHLYLLSYYLFLIQEIDGEEFIYPYIYDDSRVTLTSAGENVQFKYKDESSIYKKWKDADVIRYFNQFKYDNPEFKYKIRLDDMKANYKRLLVG